MFIISLIVVAALISYLYDIMNNKNYNSCRKIKNLKNISFNLLLFFHHLLASFLIFGWLSNNIGFLKVYTFTVLIVYLSWLIFKDNCMLTVYTNRLCGISDNIPFESLYSKIIRGIFGGSVQTKSTSEYIIFPIFIILGFIKIEINSRKS